MNTNYKVGYIVNIPMKYDPQTVEQNLQQIMQSTSFMQKREAKIVIGLNSSEAFSKETQQNIQEVFSKFSRDVGSKDLFELDMFTWQPSQDGKIPFGRIRSHLFSLQVNTQTYNQMRSKKLTKIFYLTVDADTCLTPEIIEKVEEQETKRVSPFVLCGFYEFDLQGIPTNLINPDGSLNWRGFLAKLDAQKSPIVRKDLSKLSKSYLKHPYTSGARSKELCQENCYTLRGIAFEHYDEGSQEIYRLAKLFNQLAIKPSSINPQQLNKAENKFKSHLKQVNEDEKQGHPPLHFPESKLLKINKVKQIFGSSLLYPAEPLLFVTLFQQTSMGDLDFQDLILKKNFKEMWGVEGHQEGVVLVANIKELWRQMKEQQPALRHAVERNPRKYVDFTFDYKTTLPPRCLNISEESLSYLPQNVVDLYEALSFPESRKYLADCVKLLFRGRSQTAFSKNLYEHAQTRLYVQNGINPDRRNQFSLKTLNFLNELVDKNLKPFTEQCLDRFIAYVFAEMDKSIKDFRNQLAE